MGNRLKLYIMLINSSVYIQNLKLKNLGGWGQAPDCGDMGLPQNPIPVWYSTESLEDQPCFASEHDTAPTKGRYCSVLYVVSIF